MGANVIVVGLIGIEPDRFAEIGDGAVVVRLDGLCGGAVAVGGSAHVCAFSLIFDNSRATGDVAVGIGYLQTILLILPARGRGGADERDRYGDRKQCREETHDHPPCRRAERPKGSTTIM